jgi:hypothetical protein
MNAATFVKSAKGLIFASSLIAASSVLAYAQDAPVPLGAQAISPLSGMYVGAPSGMASLGGHTFDLTSGNALFLGNGQSASFNGSWLNATNAYLLLNSANTLWYYDQTVVGNVVVTYADGTSQSTDLLVGGNLREWRTGAGAMVVGTLSDPAASNVWTGTATDGTEAVIDMLSLTLAGKTVTNVTVNDTNSWGSIAIMLTALTIDQADPTPPTVTCIRPGYSCNTPAAVNSQAEKWQAPTATSPAATPATDTKKDHSNNGHHAH